MAKKAVSKATKSATKTKTAKPTKSAKSAKGAKPKTMAAKRAVAATVEKTGDIFRSIVGTVLSSQQKIFTSADVVRKSKSSPRHSRRTLAFLVKNNALSVNRSERPYRYQISSREQLKRFA